MEKIKKEIEINRYEAVGTSIDIHYFKSLIEDEQEVDVYYNLENSGKRDFYNFLNAKEISLEKYEDIKQYLTDEKQVFTIVSFYAENGYDGVYTNSDVDCLKRKCNNWINNGADGFMYLLVAEDKERIAEAISYINNYINEGIYMIDVYDNEQEEFIDNALNTDKNYNNVVDMLKKYDIRWEDIDFKY